MFDPGACFFRVTGVILTDRPPRETKHIHPNRKVNTIQPSESNSPPARSTRHDSVDPPHSLSKYTFQEKASAHV